MYAVTNFLKNHWSAILAGAGVALVIACLAVLTTRTDAISTTTSDSMAATGASEVTITPNDKEDASTSTTAAATTGTEEDSVASSTSSSTATSKKDDTLATDPFAVSIAAESAIVWDVQNNRSLYEKSPRKELPLASLTKLMTALVGAQLARETGQETTVISRQHLDALGSNGLVAGQTWDIHNLISFMLIESSNDAARAVAAAASDNQADGYAKEFVEQMNDTARSLGLEATYFFNPSGLDLNETLISGGYGSARDIAELFSYILQTNREVLAPTTQAEAVFSSEEGTRYSAKNTNTWLYRFPETLGSKTGYTVLAGGNLVMAFDLSRPVVIVVMGSTQSGRFSDMQTLYSATKKYLANEADVTTF